MDGERFDGFTKALAGGTSRREVLRGIAGVGGAGLLAALGFAVAPEEAEAH
jgi:hypothetical protein